MLIETPTDPKRVSVALVLAFCALVAAAAGVRLWGLGDRSITHPEMWAPLIPVPEELAAPGQRTTLWRTITYTLANDTHPPGYYAMLWFWMKLFGSSVQAIRMPSVLFGAGSIALLIVLGRRLRWEAAGWVAALLLAFNGHHIFWSQAGRMHAMACFLSLAATVLLVRGLENKRWGVVYLAVLLLGLATHIFFWTLLLAHMLWVFLAAARRQEALPPIFRWQAMAAVLGSPLIAFAVYQSKNKVAILSSNPLEFTRELLQFCFLYPAKLPAIGLYGDAQLKTPPLLWTWSIIAGLVLLIAALRVRQPELALKAGPRAASSARWLLTAACMAATVIFLFGKVRDGSIPALYVRPEGEVPATLLLMKKMVALPFLAAASFIALQKYWRRWSRWIAVGEPPLIWMCAFVPLAAISALSLVKPALNARGFLFVVPYVLLLLASGLVWLVRGRVAAGVVALIFMAALHAGSIAAYRQLSDGPLDARTFASRVEPFIGQNDLVFLRRSWDTTPVLYYIRPGRYRVFADEFAEVSAKNPRARVWDLQIHERENPGAAEALHTYHVEQTIEFGDTRAVLYAPPTKNFKPPMDADGRR